MERKYCRLCNSPIDVVRRWNGLEFVTEYLSAEPGDPAFGQVIDRCPGCGESATSFRDDGFLRDEPGETDRDESKTRYIMRLEGQVKAQNAQIESLKQQNLELRAEIDTLQGMIDFVCGDGA